MPSQMIKKAMTDMDVCRRKYAGQEFRAADQDGEKHLTGHAAVFNSPTDIAGYFEDEGIPVVWELNPGNHFADASARFARGIDLLTRCEICTKC